MANQTSANPPPLAEYAGSFGGALAGPAVNGDIAYIGEGQSLTILDISDATHPARLTRLPLPDLPSDLVLDSDRLYVADRSAGLQIYDVQDPVAPVLLGVFSTPAPVTSVRIQGTLGYLVANDLLIVDLLDPAAPHQLSSFHPSASINSLVISGGRAYLAISITSPVSISGSVSIVDVSNPAAPTALSALQLSFEAAVDIQIDSNLIYVVTVTDSTQSSRHPHLLIVDISNVSSPTISGSLTLTQARSQPTNARMLLANGLAYIAGYPGGLITADIHIPTTPTLLERNPAISGGGGLRIAGAQLYALTSASYLQIISLSAPASPTLLGSYNAFALIQGVAVANGIAHIGMYYSGFQLADVHDPARPVARGGYTIAGAPNRMQLVGNRAYIVGGNSGLNILDTTDLDNPIRVGGITPNGSTLDIQVVGNLAYITMINQFVIVDISDPSNPVQRGVFSQATGFPDVGIDVVGSRAYFATGGQGLTVVDVSDPAHPFARGAYTALARASYVQVVGNRAYVAADSDGLLILDLSNPDAPALLGQARGVQSATYVRVVNNLAYVADFYGMIQIFDVRAPAAPVLLGQYAANGNVRNLDIEGDMLYIPAGDSGLQMVQLHRDQFPLTITSAPPAGGTYGAAYQHAFATSGMPTARFSLSGTLPPGLAFDASAITISGTPTQTGTWNDLTLTASYGDGHDATQTFGITIGKAPLTLAATNASKTYGQPNPALTFTAAGLLNGDTAATALTGSPATSAGATSPAGSYAITQGTLDAANYAISFAPGALTITKAPLTITAVSQARHVGQPNALLTLNYQGFVNNDDASDLDMLPSASTNADASSAAGVYAITVSGGSDTNYALTYINGTLTVTDKYIPTITWRSPAAITYGVRLTAAQLNASAMVNGQILASTFSYTPAIGTLLNAGSAQELQVTFTPADTANYTSATAQARIDVAKAPLTITAEDEAMVAGGVLPALTARYSGFVHGDDAGALDTTATLSTSASSISAPGSYAILASGAADANYAITFVSGTLTVRSAGPSLAATNGDHGRPGSSFAFAAQGFRAGEALQIAVDGRAVLVAQADASGGLRFRLFFGPATPPRSYTVTATAAGMAVQSEAGAQAQVTIDPAAPKLLPPSDTTMPSANALPTIFLPLVGL